MYDPIDSTGAAQPHAEARALARLNDFVSCLSSYTDLDDCLSQLAVLVARIFDAETSAIALAREVEGGGRDLRMLSNRGREPAGPAVRQLEHAHVAATRAFETDEPVLAQDASSAWGPAIAAPIRIDGAAVGAICLAGPLLRPNYGAADVHLLDIVSRFADRLLEVIQLRCLLNSRFAQLAVLQETGAPQAGALPPAGRNPDELAKLLARSFYREMAKSGFCSRQIINAAAEIISQLSDSIGRGERSEAAKNAPAREPEAA